MLTRRGLLPYVVGGVLLVGAVLPGAAIADDGQAGCPPTSLDCDVTGTRPGGPGSSGNTGGASGGSGGTSADPCTYRLAEPQPPAGSDGHPAGSGAYYIQTCPSGTDSVSERMLWLASPPGNLGPSPEELARRAMAKIRLDGAAIGIAPDPAGAGLVGLPVWLWTVVTPNTWGPVSGSATDGLTVTITGRATQIVWDMGDGHSVTCTNPGTPYQASYGSAASPTCGYRYEVPSRTRPGGVYRITATTTWRVDWAGGGRTGVITTTRTSQTTARIDELQVVTS